MILQFIVQNFRQKINCDYINTTLILTIENIIFQDSFVFKPELNFANYETVFFPNFWTADVAG